MSIEVRNLTKKFGTFTALQAVNLFIPTGEMVALLGPSGCGKTTLLRIIAGLESPDSGAVFFEGEDATERPAKERRVGFVFQHYALFRHMTIFENVAFGLTVRPKHKRPGKAEIRDRVLSLLRLVQLEWLADHYPSQLSGGQRQRIALARALAVEPKILLLDEPFGALDAQVRKELRRWLRRLHDELNITSIFVTHDQDEAMELARTIVVMNQGQIMQVGTPEEIYHHPASPFVLKFIGDVNLFHSRVEDGNIYLGDTAYPLPHSHPSDAEGDIIFIRPNQLTIDNYPGTQSSFPARILHINAAGSQVKVELSSEWGDIFEVEISHSLYNELKLEKGIDVFVRHKEIQISANQNYYSI